MEKLMRAMVYPYGYEFASVVRHKSMVESCNITQLVSPNGWGFCGYDASQADKGPNLNMIVKDNFEDALNNVEAVIIAESNLLLTTEDIEKVIIPKIEMATKAKKNIILAANFGESICKEVADLCTKEGVDFRNFMQVPQREYSEIINPEVHKMFDSTVPIVFVLGISQQTQKFEIQLSLREELLKSGYKVSQIGTKSYCEMLGFHSFPEFMVDSSIGEINKILMFNHYVKGIEIEEKPDVIVIGIPGGIMPFNDTFNNGFGVLAYLVSNAVTPDAAILSLLYDDYKEEHLNELFTAIKFRLGTDVTCCNIANIKFDYGNSKDQGRMLFTAIDTAFVDKKKKEVGARVPIYNVLDPEDSSLIVNTIIEELSQFGNIKII